MFALLSMQIILNRERKIKYKNFLFIVAMVNAEALLKEIVFLECLQLNTELTIFAMTSKYLACMPKRDNNHFTIESPKTISNLNR